MDVRNLGRAVAGKIRWALSGGQPRARVRFTPHASSGKRFAMHDADPLTDAGFRPLFDQERAVILALLTPSFVGRDELVTQLSTVRARTGCDCGCPTIALAADKSLSAAPVRGYVAAEASADIDGEPVQILLFARDGYMSALELVWYGEKPPRRWPPTEAMKVMDYNKPTWSDGT